LNKSQLVYTFAMIGVTLFYLCAIFSFVGLKVRVAVLCETVYRLIWTAAQYVSTRPTCISSLAYKALIELC